MNYTQRMAMEYKYREKLLEVNPALDDSSGIYILTREENGFKYAYIGQAVKLLSRLSNHFMGYQHIDLSLKKHGLFDEKKPTGWQINYVKYPISELNFREQQYIKEYANKGYQLRNKTSGSQDGDKFGIADNKPPKGYYDGIIQGRKQVITEVQKLFTKYLQADIRGDSNKIKERKLNEFIDMISTTAEADA